MLQLFKDVQLWQPHLLQAVWATFGMFVMPSQTVGQLVASPTIDFTVFPVHITQLGGLPVL